ncbi:hypothetical protein FQA39_LY05115 [Lamprigera yunnana]|nr:hypothetical protein FQA39_LY05115 [Lamprigera yunnana]
MNAKVGEKVNVAADNCHDVKFKSELVCSFKQSSAALEETQTTCCKKNNVNVTLTEEVKHEDTQQENVSEPTEEIENMASVSEGREDIPIANSHEAEHRTSKRKVRKPNWMIFELSRIRKGKRTRVTSFGSVTQILRHTGVKNKVSKQSAQTNQVYKLKSTSKVYQFKGRSKRIEEKLQKQNRKKGKNRSKRIYINEERWDWDAQTNNIVRKELLAKN